MNKIDISMDELGGLTFWGFALAATSVGFGYVLTEVRDRIVNLFSALREGITLERLFWLAAYSLGLAGISIVYWHVLSRTRTQLDRFLFE